MLRVGYENAPFKEVKDQMLGLWVIFFFWVELKRYEAQSCFIWNLWINRLTTMQVSLVAQR